MPQAHSGSPPRNLRQNFRSTIRSIACQRWRNRRSRRSEEHTSLFRSVTSYPGVKNAAGAFRLTPEELTAKLPEHNPIDRLPAMAKSQIPLFAIHGDVDQVVPLEANSGEVKKRYERLGGKMELIVPEGQGHNMWVGFFQCQELVDFVITHARKGAGLKAIEEKKTP